MKLGIIDRTDHWEAGYFGNKTRTALWSYYETHTVTLPSQNYTLSVSEKQKLASALESIKIQLKKQELRTGKTTEARLASLKKQIETALPQIQEVQMKAKLSYLQELL